MAEKGVRVMKQNSLPRILFSALIAFSVSSSAPAQTQTAEKAPQYFLILLKRPANAPQLSKEAGEKLQEEHMANIREMAAEHKLLVAGPFIDDTTLRGIFVLQAESAAQAQAWADSDPAVKAGRLSAELHGPWQINAIDIHAPAEPPGMEQYTLVLMKTGEHWNPDVPEFMEVIKRHHAFMRQMNEEGNIALAGPFPLSEAGELRGVVIYRVGQAQTAKLAEEDPVVKAGILKPELHPWATGKGVLAAGQALQATSSVPPKRIAVGGNVQAARLINQVSPVYPEEARKEKISGTVKLHVVVARDGKIQEIQVVSGHPLLVQAAIDAVKQWQYQPTLLNGQPVEVDTKIDVIFPY